MGISQTPWSAGHDVFPVPAAEWRGTVFYRAHPRQFKVFRGRIAVYTGTADFRVVDHPGNSWYGLAEKKFQEDIACLTSRQPAGRLRKWPGKQDFLSGNS